MPQNGKSLNLETTPGAGTATDRAQANDKLVKKSGEMTGAKVDSPLPKLRGLWKREAVGIPIQDPNTSAFANLGIHGALSVSSHRNPHACAA